MSNKEEFSHKLENKQIIIYSEPEFKSSLNNYPIMEITGGEKQNARELQPTHSLLDIDNTHGLFMNAKFRPFASLEFEYDKHAPSSSIGFGSAVYFPNTISDRLLTSTDLLNIKLKNNKLNIVSDEPCPICFEDIKKDNEFITGCSHRFHSVCINKWLENNNNCPMCRKKIKFANIHEQQINHIDYAVDYAVNDDNNLMNEVD
jgi:hypothetical protein